VAQPDVSALARKWKIDVNTGTFDSPSWTPILGLMEFKPSVDPNLEDDGVYDDEGWGGQTKTALSWKNEIKCVRRHDPADETEYDTGQEALRAKVDVFGASGVADVRWYDRFGSAEAYRGQAEVTWAPDGGPHTALETVVITLTGKGLRQLIENPDAASGS